MVKSSLLMSKIKDKSGGTMAAIVKLFCTAKPYVCLR
jgi:hypothetical protein